MGYPTTTNLSKVDLTFSRRMQVTTTTFLPFYLTTLLSDLGGSMGLWLGIGVLQVIQLIIAFVSPVVCDKS